MLPDAAETSITPVRKSRAVHLPHLRYPDFI
jgi:hypothetical protein